MDLVSGTWHKLTSDCNRVVLSPLPAPLLFLLDVLHAGFGVFSCLLAIVLLIRPSSLDTAVFFMALSLESPLLMFSVHPPETVQEPTWSGLYLVKGSVHSCVCSYPSLQMEATNPALLFRPPNSLILMHRPGLLSVGLLLPVLCPFATETTRTKAKDAEETDDTCKENQNG